MRLEEAVGQAIERARRLRLDPQVTISEVYEAELLGRLQPRLRGGVAWKGGTVLRLEGSERFSRDLDATRQSARLGPAKIERCLRQAGQGLAYLAGVKVERRPRSVTAAYRFVIPGLPHAVRLQVEISLREKVLKPAGVISTARLAHPYGLEPVVVARLDAAELLAEKARALVMRGAGRDIYDVYWLLQRGVEFDLRLFVRKMDYYKTIGRPVDTAAELARAAAELRARDPSRARMELANLLPAARRNLDFAVILEDVAAALQSWHRRLDSGRQRGRRAIVRT